MWLLSAFPAAIGRCTTLEPRCTTAAEEEAEAEADEKEAAERREEEAADAAEAASTWSARGRSVAGSGFWSARGVRLYMVEADKAAEVGAFQFGFQISNAKESGGQSQAGSAVGHLSYSMRHLPTPTASWAWSHSRWRNSTFEYLCLHFGISSFILDLETPAHILFDDPCLRSQSQRRVT
jgi:hypothetical protein